MRTPDFQESSLSLVSWARTARPVAWGSTFRTAASAFGGRRHAAFEPTDDDVLFAFSAATLLVVPIALATVVAFG